MSDTSPGYCEADELYIGQIATRLPSTISPNEFIKSASDEIDSKLGFMYQTPFVLDGDGALPGHQAKLIKDIAVKLASGRIILAATAAMENGTIHAYGASMVKDAQMTLMALANGDVMLSARRVDSEGNVRDEAENPEASDPLAFIPGGSNRDSQSAMAAFERNFMQEESGIRLAIYDDPYRPGDA